MRVRSVSGVILMYQFGLGSGVFLNFRSMVPILDGNLEIGVQVRNNPLYLTKKTEFPFMRAQHFLSYHLPCRIRKPGIDTGYRYPDTGSGYRVRIPGPDTGSEYRVCAQITKIRFLCLHLVLSYGRFWKKED